MGMGSGVGGEYPKLSSILWCFPPYLSSTKGKRGCGVHDGMWNLGAVRHVVNIGRSLKPASSSPAWAHGESSVSKTKGNFCGEKIVKWAWSGNGRNQEQVLKFPSGLRHLPCVALVCGLEKHRCNDAAFGIATEVSREHLAQWYFLTCIHPWLTSGPTSTSHRAAHLWLLKRVIGQSRGALYSCISAWVDLHTMVRWPFVFQILPIKLLYSSFKNPYDFLQSWIIGHMLLAMLKDGHLSILLLLFLAPTGKFK